jgi:hypothetical protein
MTMRGRTLVFATVAVILALAALIYGVMDSPPGSNQAYDRGRLDSEATTPSTNAAGRDRLPPNVRNEAPGERPGAARSGAGTTGAAGETGNAPDAARPGVDTVPRAGQR